MIPDLLVYALGWLALAVLTVVCLLRVVHLFLQHKHPAWDAKGKVIVITGASSGIGAELAIQYASEGARLVLGARRLERLTEVKRRCEAAGAANVTIVKCDVSDPAQCRDLVTKVDAVDCLVLNAGISMAGLLESFGDSQALRRVMDVNYYGSVECVLAALPLLKQSAAPKIVVISSGAGVVGLPTRTGYSASKFALNGFFEAVRRETEAKYNLAVTLICPGPVQTEINDTRLSPGAGAPGAFDMSKAMPVGKCCELIREGVKHNRRSVVFTPELALLPFLEQLAPSVVDMLLTRKLKRAGILPKDWPKRSSKDD